MVDTYRWSDAVDARMNGVCAWLVDWLADDTMTCTATYAAGARHGYTQDDVRGAALVVGAVKAKHGDTWTWGMAPYKVKGWHG